MTDRWTRKTLLRSVFPLAVILAVLSACSSGDGSGVGGIEGAFEANAKFAVNELESRTASLRTRKLDDALEESIDALMNDVSGVILLFEQAAAGEPSDGVEVIDLDSSTVVYVGLNLAAYEAARRFGGDAEAGSAAGDPKALVTGLLAEAKTLKVKEADNAGFLQSLERAQIWLAQALLLKDKAVTDQLVPADSPLRTGWDADGDGSIDPPVPPLPGVTADAWTRFSEALTFERNRVPAAGIGRALHAIDDGVLKEEPTGSS